MKIEFKGLVRESDSEYDHRSEVVEIGGSDVVDWLEEKAGSNKVSVFINGELKSTGKVIAVAAWGYSEYTPMESECCQVGGYDLLEELQNLQGQEIILLVTDEKLAA